MLNPFIPLDNADTVIIDGRASIEIIANLEKRNINIIPTIKCLELEESISYHPDICIHPINHNTLMIAPNNFEYYEDKLSGMGIKLIKGEKHLESKYPLDCAYNVGRIKGAAIHNFKYTDEKLKFYLLKENLELINVNQGYTKCSMAIISQDCIITSDYPIYKKLVNLDYQVLLIKPGYIKLKNQKYGFIGGSTGNFSQDEILISGRLDHHPDMEKIVNFILKNGKKLNYLSSEPIVDLGTIISLNCN